MADRSAPSVEGCSAKSLDQMSTDNDQQKINVKTKRKATIKFQHSHKYNATILCNICIANSSTNILQRSKYLQSCFGIRHFIVFKIAMIFSSKICFFDGKRWMEFLWSHQKWGCWEILAKRWPMIVLLWYTYTFSRYICQIFLYFCEPASHPPDIFVEKCCIALLE